MPCGRPAMSRIGLDHFARPEDELARAFAAKRLRRNFQGYTADPAAALIGLGASAISALPQGYLQNTAAHRRLWRNGGGGTASPPPAACSPRADDRLRRDIIDDLMCFLAADLGEIAAPPWPDAARFASERERAGRSGTAGHRAA